MADIDYIFARGNNQGRQGLGLVGSTMERPEGPGGHKTAEVYRCLECQGSVNPWQVAGCHWRLVRVS